MTASIIGPVSGIPAAPVRERLYRSKFKNWLNRGVVGEVLPKKMKRKVAKTQRRKEIL